jgi:hypothetical protein
MPIAIELVSGSALLIVSCAIALVTSGVIAFAGGFWVSKKLIDVLF